MNTILPQTMVLPATRNSLRSTGDTMKKLKTDREYEHINELASMIHNNGWQRDCTMMLDLL
jgi:hypothetical protein